MDDREIDRLSSLAGVHDFEEWQQQLVDAQPWIEQLLRGGVKNAWGSCLPIWIALGRANDFARCVRAPKYWPSFATSLAREFAARFENEHNFLVSVLVESDPASTQYLIAYDLLEMMVAAPYENAENSVLFAIDLPVPPVIEAEIRDLPEYGHIARRTVGAVLQRKYEIDWTDEG